MSTLPELADKLNRADRFFRRWFGVGHNPCLTGPLDSITEVAAELRQQPQPVNAELLEAQRIIDYVPDRDMWGFDYLLRCAQEVARALISRAESVEKAPAQPKPCSKCNGTRKVMFDQIGDHDDWGLRAATENENSVDCPRCAAPAQPDVVSGLVDALTDCFDVIEPTRDEFNKQGQYDAAKCCDEVLAFGRDQISIYEAQSKAEPKGKE